MTIENRVDAPVTPAAGFRERLLDIAKAAAAEGKSDCAAILTEEVESWWTQQREREQALSALLELHHEINNALVGVRGHAQLLLHGTAGNEPKVRDRLEVIIRESGRIEKAAQQVRQIGSQLAGSDPASHAA